MKYILTVLSLFSALALATPNFVPVQSEPSLASYSVTNGTQMCYYPYVDELGTVSGYPVGAMGLTRMAGASRLGSVHCNVSVDNSRSIDNVIITGGQSVSSLPGAAECNLIIKTSVVGQSHTIPMDAIYVVPNASISRYIAEDINSTLAGASVVNAQINCGLGVDVSSFRIDNIGVSYY